MCLEKGRNIYKFGIQSIPQIPNCTFTEGRTQNFRMNTSLKQLNGQTFNTRTHRERERKRERK